LESSSEDNITSLEDSKSDFDSLEKFMGFKGKALKDLDNAKSDLEKRAAQIQELATKTSEQFGGAIKINTDLKEKITFLQDLISSLSRKNERALEIISQMRLIPHEHNVMYVLNYNTIYSTIYEKKF